MEAFIGGFIVFGALAVLIAGGGLWLLTLIIPAITFSWTFVIIVSAIIGFLAGLSFSD